MPLFRPTRVLSAKFSTTSTTSIGLSNTKITYGTEEFNNSGSSMSSGVWTVPAWFTGTLFLTHRLQFASGNWTTGELFTRVFKNTVDAGITAQFTQATASGSSSAIGCNGSTTITVVGGDTLEWYAVQTETGGGKSLSGAASSNNITIYGIMP